jgi:hypothetical protein
MTTSTRPLRIQKLHAALDAGQVLTVTLGRADPIPVFFGQSSLDHACGLHCFVMVLSILGLAKPCALERMSQRHYGVPADVFAAFIDYYHRGISSEDFVTQVKSLNLPLAVHARHREDADLERFTMQSLERGDLVAVAFKSLKTCHWALAICIEGQQHGRTFTADKILLLDPAGVEPVFRVHNAWLKLIQSRKSKSNTDAALKRRKPLDWSYESPDWRPELVRIIGAIRFRLIAD